MNVRLVRCLSLPILLRAGALCLALLSPPGMAAQPEIRVGQSIDLSGIHGDIGKDYLSGASVYFDYVNSKGGVHGRKIVLDARDNQSSAEKSAQITRDFLGKDKADVLFGYFGEGSLETLLQDQAFARSGLALVAPLSGAAPATPGNIFFLRPSYTSEVKNVLQYFLGHGLKQFAVVYSENRYGKSALQAVETELRGHGLALAAQQGIRADSGQGLEAAVKAIAARKPQAVIVMMETIPAAQFIKAFRSLNPGVQLLGLSQINNQTLVELAGSQAATGMVISQVVPHPADFHVPAVRELDKLMRKYRDEAPSHLTLEGFLAAKLLVDALTQSGVSQQRLAHTLKAMRNVDLGGFYVDYSDGKNRASRYVDVNAISRSGRLIN